MFKNTTKSYYHKSNNCTVFKGDLSQGGRPLLLTFSPLVRVYTVLCVLIPVQKNTTNLTDKDRH